MSWYFLGGFSAWRIEPSGRRQNHSGCSCTQGWSGEHWARSRAPPRGPRSPASAGTAGSRRACPARGRRRCGRPRPSRWPTGCRGRPGPPPGCCWALATTAADRVDGRQVHDVEAHVGDGRQPFGGADGSLGGTARTRRRTRQGPIDPERPRVGGREVGTWHPGHQPCHPVVEPGVEPDARCTTAGAARPRPRAPARSRTPTPGRATRGCGRPPRARADVVAHGRLDLDVVAPGGEQSPQASTTISCRPIWSGHRVPDQRSLTSPAIGVDRHFERPARRQRTRAPGCRDRRRRCRPTRRSARPPRRFTAMPAGVAGRRSSMVMRPSTPRGTQRGVRSRLPSGGAASRWRPAPPWPPARWAIGLSISHRGSPDTIQRGPVSSMSPALTASSRSISPSHIR